MQLHGKGLWEDNGNYDLQRKPPDWKMEWRTAAIIAEVRISQIRPMRLRNQSRVFSMSFPDEYFLWIYRQGEGIPYGPGVQA